MSPREPSLAQRLAELHPGPLVARGIFAAAALLLSLLHLFQNALNISSAELWLDEASTYLVAQYPLGRALTLPVEFHSQPPLYYALLHFLSRVDSSESVIRGASWLACLLLVGFVLFELNELRIVSRVAFCLLFVTNKVTLYLSQELRPYGLAVLTSFVASVLFLRLVRRPRSRRLLVASTLASLTMACTLAFNVWVLAAHGLFAAGLVLASLKREGLRRTVRELWPIVASLGVIGAAYYPYVRFVQKFQHQTGKPLPAVLNEAFKPDHYTAIFNQFAAAADPFTYVIGALIVHGLLCELRKKNRTVLLWVLLFFGQIAFVHGFLLGRVVGSYRYILPAFPAFLFCVGLGLDHLAALRLPRFWPVALATLMLLVLDRHAPFKASLHSPAQAANWRRLYAEMKKVPGKKGIFFDTGYYAQMLEYVARADDDFTFFADGYAGLDAQRSAGGNPMTEAYIKKTVAAQAGALQCFFYSNDRRPGHKSLYEPVFVPEMKKLGYQKVFTLETDKVADAYHDYYVVTGFCRAPVPGS